MSVPQADSLSDGYAECGERRVPGATLEDDPLLGGEERTHARVLHPPPDGRRQQLHATRQRRDGDLRARTDGRRTRRRFV